MTRTRAAVAAKLRGPAAAMAVGIGPAAAAGYAVQARSALALPILGAVIALWVFASPSIAGIFLGASLPALQDLAGGRLGVKIALADAILVLLAARIAADAVVSRGLPALRVLRPVGLPVLQYAWLLGILVLVHAETTPFLNTLQRFEIVLVALLVGAYLALRRDHTRLLQAYVIVTAGLAVAWPLDLLGLQAELQKNPTGQLLANAILLLAGIRSLRPLLPCLPLLVVGLLLTGSRGAILAALVGLTAISIMHGGRSAMLVVARTLPMVLTAAIAFQWLAPDLQARLTDFRADSTTAGDPIALRYEYRRDAQSLIAAHPWAGVGVGQYGSASTKATDPHNVVLQEAAEGGVPLAASFILLVLGTLFALWRLRRVALAPAAAGVVAATAAHGLVDVYWVRITPVLGWLLVGMVCALGARAGAESQR